VTRADPRQRSRNLPVCRRVEVTDFLTCGLSGGRSLFRERFARSGVWNGRPELCGPLRENRGVRSSTSRTGLAVAAVYFGDIRAFQQFQVSVAHRGVQLLPGLGIVQAAFCQDEDAIHYVSELPNSRVRQAFSFGDYAEAVVVRLSRNGDPLQLVKQSGELRRAEAAGSACGQGGAEGGILFDDGKQRRACQPFESRAPFRALLERF